jgi:hypothetical protein
VTGRRDKSPNNILARTGGHGMAGARSVSPTTERFYKLEIAKLSNIIDS